MGFCRRCGDIVSGERCKCGGAAVAPVVSWRDQDTDNYDKWTRTYVSRERFASVGASQAKRLSNDTPTSLSMDLSHRVSAHITAVASTAPRTAPLLRRTKTGPVPEAGILPSPCDSTLSKVYGSVLQPKESLATFSCLICSTVFPPDATIYPDPRSLDAATENRFLCRPCFITNGGSKGTCPTCSRPVLTLKSEGGFIHAANKYWHKRCFNCNGCQRNIGDVPLVDLLGRPSCEGCFDTCLRRDRGCEQEPSTPRKRASSSAHHGPTAQRNIGGIDTSSIVHGSVLNSREASPALDELEQRLGIVRNTRSGSPSLEELSQRLSSIGKEPSRAHRDSRHSERYRSPEPEDAFSSSPDRTGARRYSAETSSPVRKQVTGVDGACSPAPTPEAIEEMKSRFMRTTLSSPSIPPSPLNNLAQSFSTSAHTSTRMSLGSRLPAPTQTQRGIEGQIPGDECNPIENDIGSTLISSGESPSCEPPKDTIFSTDSRHDEHSDTAEEAKRLDCKGDYKEAATNEITDDEPLTPVYTPCKGVETKQTPPSRIPVANKSPNVRATTNATTLSPTTKSVNDESTSSARCAKCEGLLFSTKGGGKYLTLPAEEGAKSKMYHVECFRCTICDGQFKEGGKGQAVFVKAKGGPCHVECAPPEKRTIRKSTSTNSLRSNYVKSAVAASGNMVDLSSTDTNRTLVPSTSRNMNPVYTSSRFESPFTYSKTPTISSSSNNLGASGFRRFGSQTICPGCSVSVSPMERGVVPGPQGTRWHAKCLVCGGKRRSESVAQQKTMWMIGRGSGGEEERKRKGEPGCGKRLDSAAKTDVDGGVWCRECLLLLGSSSPTSPLISDTTTKGIASQYTGTTIARQFTGLGFTNDSGKDSGLLKQLTGGGLSPTRSISPTKQLGSASGRPRPKSVIGIRSTKSIDAGRGMFLVRQMTGADRAA